MPYVLSPFEGKKSVLLRFEGEVSVPEKKEALQHPGELLAAREWGRLLICVTHVTSKLSTMEIYELAREFLLLLPSSVMIALVAGPAQAKDAKFFVLKDVAFNRSVFLASFADTVT